ncbi:MAG: NAD(P)-dependent alcohol dehydrogenase [Chloroflexota bacterium]
MKAIIFPTYGTPDVLQLVDKDIPTPDDNQVLIKVHTAAANPLDWHRMLADPVFVRLSEGLLKPKNTKLGADIAGTVEAVGKNVTQFKVGERVFGEIGSGGFAEYALAPEKYLAHIPDNVSFADAAAIPVVGFTALQGLRDTGKIQAGQTVLVNGASGGVGSTAVQIAKAYDTIVTGVCSTRNLDLVRSIGADHVIDYTQGSITQHGNRYDLVYDAVGNLSVRDFKQLLTPTGRAVVAGFTTLGRMVSVMIMGAWASKKEGQFIGSMGTAQPNQEDLQYLANLMATGKLKSVIDCHYSLEDTAEALRYLLTMRARGKVLIDIAH